MRPLALRVESLRKRYTIRHQAAPRYRTLRDEIMGAFRRMGGGLRRQSPGPAVKEDFYAVDDVSFTLEQGKVLGVIGRNGAGKSTLLKLLSRITEPSAGRISIKGRVASLLEVGTGFHPELTGRENVYLNGAVLGMGRQEVRKKFDEIVAFAGTERFLDTQVKHYSSGMYMRLAFSVAAHLQPDILIVDEVLAVGDQEFQTKCLDKMKQVSESGQTILFVSHNLTAIGSLCQVGMLMSKGKIAQMGPVLETLATYRSMTEHGGESLGAGNILKSARLVSVHEAVGRNGMFIEMEFEADFPEEKLGIDLLLRHENYPVLHAATAYYSNVTFEQGHSRVRCVLGPVNLASGSYLLDVHICRPQVCWIEENFGVLRIEIDRQHGEIVRHDLQARRLFGFVIPDQEWWKVDPNPQSL